MTDWPSFLDQHGPAVWRRACRLLGNEADAADCYQDVFIAAWKLSSAKGVANWAGLLARMTTSRALDRLRQRFAGRRFLTPGPDWESLLSNEPGPPERAQQTELAEAFRHLISKLPKRQAQVLWMHAIDELTHEEIARQLGAKPGAIAATLHRARKKLRRFLPQAADSKKQVDHDRSA